MNEFIKILLSLSFSGTLLLLIVFLLKQIYKDKFSKCWQYYIWLVVALRFLIPFTVETTITGRLFTTADTPVIHHAAVSGTIENRTDDTAVLDNELQSPIDPIPYLLYVWAALALVFIIRKITIYQSFMRYVKAGNTEVSDIEILNLLAGCEEKLNIGKTIELYCNPLIASPIMTGFFRPSIIIPANQMIKGNLPYIFAHELIHYKRRDILYKWFIQLVICIHWFNPFIYLLGRETNKACELSCDEAVIGSLDDKSKKAYGDILLSALKTDNTYKNSLASLTLTEGGKQLKERLGSIMNFKKKSKTIMVVTAILTMFICISFNTLGAYAKPGGSKDAAKQQPAGMNVSYENGIYYIFVDGATKKDKPNAAFTNGTLGIVLVRKDSYASFGPFSSTNKLIKEMEDICKGMLKNGSITKEEAAVLLETADKIQHSVYPLNEQEYVYTQGGYYQNSFIIEMGWNLNTGLNKPYSKQKEIVLADASKMTVYFADTAKQYSNDKKALAAIGKLIDSLKANKKLYPAIKKPLIVSITPVAAGKIPALAKEYFKKNDVVKFSAIFPILDKAVQREYYSKIYDAGKIALFSTVVEHMDEDTVLLYADKSEQDSKINFFAVLLEYMRAEDRKQYAKKYYKEKNIARFSILLGYMTEEEKQNWLIKAQNDKRNTFYAVIAEELSN